MKLGSVACRARGILIVALACTSSVAHAAALTNVFFFGDSVSDQGNAALLNSPPGNSPTGNPPSRSPVPYPDQADGFTYTPVYVPPWRRPYETSDRFTNSNTWTAAFANALGFSSAAAPSLSGGNNYAVGGASVVPLGGTPPNPPALVEQLASFRQAYAEGMFDPTALYVIEGGGNDLLEIASGNPQASAEGIVRGLGFMVQNLLSWGAQNIIVWQVPDITLAPQFRAGVATGLITPEQGALVLALVNGVNQQIEAFDALPGVDIFPVTDLFRGVVSNPGAFGLVDANSPCGFVAVFSATQGQCTSSFLFWDGVHPTSAGHQITANAMLAVVPEPSVLLLLLVACASLLSTWHVRSTASPHTPRAR